jgi:predicted metal-dependent peptidase
MSNENPIITEDDFERFIVDCLRSNPFLAYISRFIRKIPSTKLPTAGVTYCTKTDDLVMYYNLDFFSGLTRAEATGVFHHELSHIQWDHIGGRRREPHKPWNIATDLAINSIIINDYKGTLPENLYIPGMKIPLSPDGKVKALRAIKNDDGSYKIETYERQLTEQEIKLHQSYSDLIEGFPHGKASEWYFDRLAEWHEEHKNEYGKRSMDDLGTDADWFDSFDDHEGWGDVPEDLRDLVSGKCRDLVRRAAAHADSQSNGWGNIPEHMREEIRKFANRSVDWKSVLRYFVGIMARGQRSSTFKRINKRYPYIHPGTKRGYRARVAMFIDQSGSVSDVSIAKVFGVLSCLSKTVEFDVFHFDTEVDEKSKMTWKRGSSPKFLRTRCGGTCFQSVTDYVNDPKNRGKYDGYIILTDMQAPKPGPSRVKRAWIIVPGEKINFDTNEMVVTMRDDVGDGR